MGGYGSAGNGGTSVGVIVLSALVLLASIVLLATRKHPRRPAQPGAA